MFYSTQRGASKWSFSLPSFLPRYRKRFVNHVHYVGMRDVNYLLGKTVKLSLLPFGTNIWVFPPKWPHILTKLYEWILSLNMLFF